MVHLIFCLRRQPQLSRAEFQRYWREQHARLVRTHAAVLGIKRYVQAHTVDHPVAQAVADARDAPEPFDGVAELWFEIDDMAERMQTPAAREAGRMLLEDERRFIDLRRSPIFIATDHVVIDNDAGG